MITIGTSIKVSKGCRAYGVSKGDRGRVIFVDVVPEYGTKVTVAFSKDSLPKVWWLRHAKWLENPTVRLNRGNPLQTIEIQAVA